MRRYTYICGVALLALVGSMGVYRYSYADVNVNASSLLRHTQIYFSPSSGTFTEGSTFDVPIMLDTKGTSINSVEVRINFDKNKLSIVKPSTGVSIIGVWVEPPKYDNTRGTASYVGVIPNGITTQSGLVGTITFKALSSGRATVKISSDSNVLLNDGLGTNTILDQGRAEYVIVPKAPDGVTVFSETHPSQSTWYNNTTPVIAWEKETGVDGFSIDMDDKPFTIPDNTIDTQDTTKSYETLPDGLHYFHVKAHKNGAWGNTTHFLIRIDSTPPAEFTPTADYVVASAILAQRSLVSFFTTDNASGVDHYEVGSIDKDKAVTESPTFVQAESPFQVPLQGKSNLKVIVRAFDKAGNVRDASIDVKIPFFVAQFINNNLVYILLFIILAGIVGLIIHYLVGHHIVRHLRRVFAIAEREEEKEHSDPPPNFPFNTAQ